ncbi:MAG: truB [Paenibacillaceae bacterium]|jgi:tRNA pseudouridine55 synthase|nr:truB [Paenibacillaceae bacterium]
MSLEGVLPIWKPVQFTSHDVVAKARGILKMKRIGHTGTLDPMVTGVLPLCLGRATRLVEYIQEMPKEYEARLVIGLATDTEDLTGKVIEKANKVTVNEPQIHDVMGRFIGVIEQIPPMYSAVKVDGKRLYELARGGEVVERQPRQVSIHSIHILSLKLDVPEPEIVFRVRCSKGTYIRTLCSDIGRALGYPAVMAELVRTGTGGMTRQQCATLEELAEARHQGDAELAQWLIPADQAISFFPAVEVDSVAALHARQGKKIRLAGPVSEQPVLELPEQMRSLKRVYGPGADFLGLFRLEEDGRTLAAEKVFLPEA